MRGKIAKRCRKIASGYAKSYNDTTTVSKMSHKGGFEQRILSRDSVKAMVKRIKQLLDHVPHYYKASVMETLVLDENGHFSAVMWSCK